MDLSETAAAVLIATGCFFFFAGTAGLLRFPDVYARLHALTKADTIGLGFVAAGVMILSGSLFLALKIFAVWLFTMYAGSLASYLVANAAYRYEKAASERKGDG